MSAGEKKSKKETCDAGSLYHGRRVRRGIQPPSTPHTHSNILKKYSKTFIYRSNELINGPMLGMDAWAKPLIPVMATVAVRKKVVSIGYFYLYSLQILLFVRSNQKQIYVLIALKIRER